MRESAAIACAVIDAVRTSVPSVISGSPPCLPASRKRSLCISSNRPVLDHASFFLPVFCFAFSPSECLPTFNLNVHVNVVLVIDEYGTEHGGVREIDCHQSTKHLNVVVCSGGDSKIPGCCGLDH